MVITNDGEGGILVSYGDVAALVNAMEKLLLNPGYAYEVGRRGHEIVESTYNSKDVGQRLIDVYERVC